MNKHDHRNDDDHDIDDLLREEGRQFDVIFGDLTDIPVHGNDTSTWNFVRWRKKPSGRYIQSCHHVILLPSQDCPPQNCPL